MHIGSVECAGRAVGDSETAANLGAKKVIKPPTFRRRLMNTLGALTVGVITGNLAGVLDPRDLTPVAADNPRPAGIMVDDSEYFSRMAESVVSPFAKSTLNRSEVDPKNYETRTLMNGRKLTKIEGDWSNDQLNMIYVSSGHQSEGAFLTDVELALDTSIRLNIEPFPQVRSKHGHYAIPIEQLNLSCSFYVCSSDDIEQITNSVLRGGFLPIGVTIITQESAIKGRSSVTPIDWPKTVYGGSVISTGAIRSGLAVAAIETTLHNTHDLTDEWVYTDVIKRPQPDGQAFWNCIKTTVKDKYWSMLLGPAAPAGFAGCGEFTDTYRDADFDLLRGNYSRPYLGEVDKAVILRNTAAGVSRYQVPDWFVPVTPTAGPKYFAYMPVAVK